MTAPAPKSLHESLRGDYPARGSSAKLRERLLGVLRDASTAAGASFFTDADLVELTGLSRSTVRRAMDKLQAEGWVQREIGRGTFVGPRAGVRGATPATERGGGGPRLQRVAVASFRAAHAFRLQDDWYTAGLLEGLDRTSHEHGVAVEVLGLTETRGSVLAERIRRSRPDMLVCLAPNLSSAELLVEARRSGIRCLSVAPPAGDPGTPLFVEDNLQGARLAVDHLADLGHERIGFMNRRFSAVWLHERQQGHVEALAARTLPDVEGLTCWIGPVTGDFTPRSSHLDAIARWLDRSAVTAVVCGTFDAALAFQGAAGVAGRRVPDDLSVLSFDDHPRSRGLFDGRDVTRLGVPLQEMGAEIARVAGEGLALDPIRRFGFEITLGETTSPPLN